MSLTSRRRADSHGIDYTQIDSPSKPSIIQTPSGPVNPGNFITITCEIQGGNPLAVISWQCKDSTPIAPTENPITNISVSSVRLKVKIDDSGDVCMCVGSHPAWTKQKIYNITLSVRKPVTKVILTPASFNNVISVEDGENKTFTCTTDLSDLTAFIQWYFDGQNITNQAIPQPPLMRSGKFISSSKLIYTGKEEDINKTIYCEAVSIEGEYSVTSIVQSICILFGPKSISLNPAGYLYVELGIRHLVLYLVIAISVFSTFIWEHVYRFDISFLFSDAPTILRLQALNSNTVDEHQSVTFQCEVDSYPAPDITWVHSITGTLLKKVKKVFKSNFTILKTECLQTGTYRCQTSNVIGDMLKTVYAEIDLFVLCSARMDERRIEEPGFFAIMENDDWNITVYLIAYPEPMINWTRRNSETGIISIMNLYNSFTSNISEHSSTLRIRKISKSDYGVYTMNASNNIGLQYIKSFEVIPLDPPDQPTDIFVVCEVTSMIVSWRSGFNGGSQQKFRVAWLNIRTQNTKHSPKLMDYGQGQTIQYINKSLEPSTSYNIYVEATNKQGVVKSGNTYCTTGSSLSQSNNTIAISVGASIGSSMLILIIAVLVVLFLRRRPCKKEENPQLYQSTYPDKSRQKTNIDQHTYDELQTIKKGSNPEYEQVNRYMYTFW
ncbi:cell adhesion molecule DSCAM-like [Mytilus trossulus]|uniref:cell adhesion molecule DSCAM-like n=1 Tax=Mytilus trossulus TaxID=6551 RepID=UPI003006CF82